MTYQPKFKFWDGKTMSHPMSLDDLAYEGFPSQFVNDHGDSVKGAIALQFTGMKDRNGVEIYTGDVLEFGDETEELGMYGSVGRVLYNENIGAYRCLLNDGRKVRVDEHNMFNSREIIRNILGNIYENPGLTKQF